MKNKQEIAIVDKEYLEDKIYVIRGQKVMLDSDLAKIYGYSTKRFNEQVHRNIEKFADGFMFRLTKEEVVNLVRSQNATSPNRTMFKGQDGGLRHLPYAFTEFGIYMLMTVLKGPLATKQCIALIKAFKYLKDLAIENNQLIPVISNKEIELRTEKLENRVDKIETNLNTIIDKFSDKESTKHLLILNGEYLEADIAYESIFKKAKKSIIYIDDYIGIKTFYLLLHVKPNIPITVISDNKARPRINQTIVNDFINERPNNKLTLLKSNGKCHDRYIILDYGTKHETIYHSGSSIKDAGNKITTITKIEDTKVYRNTIKSLLKGHNLRLEEKD